MDSFDGFWQAYPRKTAKGAARIAYIKALKKAHWQILLTAAQDLANQKGRENKYTPHASTWLNQERWEDELIQENASISKSEANRLNFLNKWNNPEQLSLEGVTNEPQRSI